MCRFSIGPIGFTNQTGEGPMKLSSISCYGPMKYTLLDRWNKIIVRQTVSSASLEFCLVKNTLSDNELLCKCYRWNPCIFYKEIKPSYLPTFSHKEYSSYVFYSLWGKICARIWSETSQGIFLTRNIPCKKLDQILVFSSQGNWFSHICQFVFMRTYIGKFSQHFLTLSL